MTESGSKSWHSTNLSSPEDGEETLVFQEELDSHPIDPILLKIRELEQSLIGTQMPGFFPTPDELAQRLVKMAGIERGTLTLEPSAGIGNIAIAARKAGAIVDCVELRPQLIEILRLKGLSVREGNFLDMVPDPVYQSVLLNPPFEEGQGAIHIMRAYDWLVKGGKLVAIANEAITSNERDIYIRFRAWLKEVGGTIEPLSVFAFYTAFRPTIVKTVIIVAVK